MQNLTDFYNKKYKEVLNNYYIDLIGNKFLNIIKYGIVYMIFSFFPSFIYIVNVKDYRVIVVIYNIVLWTSYFLNIKFKNKKVYENMNLKVIYDMVKFISNSDFLYKENFQIKENLFKNMNIFNYDLLNYSGKNVFEIPYKNNYILLSDVSLFSYDSVETSEIIDDRYIKKTIRKVRKDRFSGLYLELQLSKKNDCYIYLVPNNINDKYLSKYINYSGDKILLEDVLFNKKYTVYSSDQVMARYVLSIDLMDKINQIDNIIPNKKYIVFKDDQTVGIFINDYSFDSIRKTRVPIKRNDEIELNYINDIYNKVNCIFKIYDILDLNKEIYNI